MNFVQTVLAGVIAAVIGAVAALIVAYDVTKRIKRAEATLDFSHRYHELWVARNELNERFRSEVLAEKIEPLKKEGMRHWHRFFDLMLFQFLYLKDGLLHAPVYSQWMVSHGVRLKADDDLFQAGGVSYYEGWKKWKEGHGGGDEAFVSFSEKLHGVYKSDIFRSEYVHRLVSEIDPPKQQSLALVFTILLVGSAFFISRQPHTPDPCARLLADARAGAIEVADMVAVGCTVEAREALLSRVHSSPD